MNGARAVETAAVPGGSRIPGGSVRRPPGRGLPDLTAAARRLPGEHELVQVVQARGAASPSSSRLTLDRGLEREAARAAAAVAGRSGGIGRAGAAEGGTTSAAIPPVVDAALRSPGLPLEPDTRRLMESRFGRDFGEVRVHTDAEAAAAATAIDAIAFTAGREIVFGAGGYAPRTGEGREIIAHELAHVLQQRASSGSTAERPTEAGALDVRQAAAAPAIQRLPIKPAEEAAAYIADEDELRDRLAAMTAAQRQGLLGFVLTQVRHNWARADSLGLIEMLERVPLRGTLPGRSPRRGQVEYIGIAGEPPSRLIQARRLKCERSSERGLSGHARSARKQVRVRSRRRRSQLVHTGSETAVGRRARRLLHSSRSSSLDLGSCCVEDDGSGFSPGPTSRGRRSAASTGRGPLRRR